MKPSYDVTLITGDGIGPEISEVTKRCLDACGIPFNWDIQTAGEEILAKEGTPLPNRVIESIRRNKVALKAPITTPIGKGYGSPNVALRKELDLFACVRPFKSYKGVPSKYQNVDLVIIRENTEDLYSGIEFERGTPVTLGIIRELTSKSGAKIPSDSGISIKAISARASERIVRFAFEYARKNNRKKVTVITKANIMKYTDGLFLEVARAVARRFPDIEYEETLVDHICMQLVQRPERYDLLVTPNLYGDIISDLAAGLVGGLGVSPGANIGDEIAVFEATHGSAPQLKGLNKANPSALILSGAMMLRHLGERAVADMLETAIKDVIQEGRNVTCDLKPNQAVGTREMGNAIMDALLKHLAEVE